MSDQKQVLLELNKLKKYFPVRKGVNLKAVEDISLKIYEGEKFGVVGESGCGKSTLGRVILQLYPQTSGACVYYGKSLEEVSPAYVAKEIAHLTRYQQKAREFYQKSLEIDRKIAELNTRLDALSAQGTDREVKAHWKLSKEIAELEYRSHELRKDASRQLREGSRTAGSLILCENIAEIQQLFQKALECSLKAREAQEQYDRSDARYGEALVEGQADAQAEKELEEYGTQAARYRAEARKWREQAFSFRGKNIQMITERCGDPEYWDKLDRNYETGINLGKLSPSELRALRRDMQMIFQDPAASLDPRQSIGKAIEEVFDIHTDYGPQLKKEKALELLDRVGLKAEQYDSYPHQLSGGQKQRVGIARAIALNPKFVVLDESVSALDVSVQAQILQLLDKLRDQQGLTYFFITHNLGVVKHFCDRVMVMYLGNLCELSPSHALFDKPLHPYTRSLFDAVPRPAVRDGLDTSGVLEGEVPSAVNPPKGCPFHTRCPHCTDRCKTEKPSIREVAPGHLVACHLYD